jgi:hypothetical protein
VVAAGSAMIASRLINGGGSSSGSGGTQQDPGVRVQLPPATDNKVPVIYGSAYTKGAVTDAYITADNKTMTYVLVLGEKTQTGTFTIGDIYWNDELLVFGSGADTYKVASSIDQNGQGNTSTNYSGYMEMRVYAGTADDSNNQIFPTTNKVSARSYVGTSVVPSTWLMSDLVYAVVKLTYSSEKSVTGLSQMTFQVNNSLSNPGLVLYDYLTSSRYGAGIDPANIDTTSMTSTATTTSLYSIANEIPSNQYESDGITTSTQARYIINGVISAGDSVKSNLERIAQASSSWLTYDFIQGRWTVIVNRALGVSELAACRTYNDDNILGEVSVNATNLEDLYNSLEVEFPSREIRDQNDYYRSSISAGDRNDLEPDNILNLRYDLINNAIHAQRLGTIDLQQSRIDKSIQFRTTYQGLQTVAGDVIKVTNEVYGFTDKLFRVTRVREVELETGGLTAEITALEYDSTVYGDTNIIDYAPNQTINIPSFSSSVALPAPSYVRAINTSSNNNIPSFQVSTTIDSTSAPVDQVLWYYSTSGNFTYITNEVGPFQPGQLVTDTITGLPAGYYYLHAKTQRGPNLSPYSLFGPGTNSAIDWNPQPGGVNNGTISTSTNTTNVLVTNTTSGQLKIPLVATTSGFQSLYADTELTYDASANVLSVPGVVGSTGTKVLQSISAGGFPLDANGQALILQANTQSAAMIVSNYTAGIRGTINIRSYGQNQPGGTATTTPAATLNLDGARGTGTAPTALQSSDTIGVIGFSGFDGNYFVGSQNSAGSTSLPTFQMVVQAAENWAASATTTTNAGTSMFMRVQAPGAQLTATSRAIWLAFNWTAGSTATNSPPVMNLGIGQHSSGNPTQFPSSGVGSFGTGTGATVLALNSVKQTFFGVCAQDSIATGADNATITATNVLTFATGRQSAVSGRRNALLNGDTVLNISANAQTAAGGTGSGSTVGQIAFSMLENAGGSARGTRFAITTVNSGTTSLVSRLALDDQRNLVQSDSHVFRDKSGTFTALSMTTATATFTAIPVIPNYTVAGKPATGAVGQMICISNSTPGGMMAYWDTTNARWSYVHDNSAV